MLFRNKIPFAHFKLRQIFVFNLTEPGISCIQGYINSVYNTIDVKTACIRSIEANLVRA